MAKISFDDLKIGDTILTTNNRVGEVIALKSYAYLNDKIDKKSSFENDLRKPFKFDNTRHNGIWYAAVTIAIEDKDSSIPSYYVENLDFIEIKEIIRNEAEKETILDKIKKNFID